MTFLVRINYYVNEFFIILSTCYRRCCFMRKIQPQQTEKKSMDYNLPILNFFKTLLLVIRAKFHFQERSIYRPIKNLKDYHYDLIGDLAFSKKVAKKMAERKNHNYSIKGFYPATFRKLKRTMKKKFKKLSSFLVHSLSIVFFL